MDWKRNVPIQPHSAAVVWSDDYLNFQWSRSHPMNPVRLALTMSLARSFQLFDSVLTMPPIAVSELLTSVHTSEYVEAVSFASEGMRSANEIFKNIFGLGNLDNPIFTGMHEAAELIVGGTVGAAKLIASGVVTRAVNISGGMHHAMPNHASGFCIYNDAAISIKWLLANGFDRVAYLDIDAHHGDGVQNVFFQDPRVLTISVHQSPETLWPYSGFATEVGGGVAKGTAVNLGLPPHSGNGLWLRAFHAVVPSVIAEFKPQIIVSQCGADSHRDDPLADLAVTVDGHRASYQAISHLANTHCDGRWLAIGGGGYGLVNVVPRSWTHLIAAVVGKDISLETEIGDQWLDVAKTETAKLAQLQGPLVDGPAITMGDGISADFSPWDGTPHPVDVSALATNVDCAIQATRDEIFPHWGLDPEDPRD